MVISPGAGNFFWAAENNVSRRKPGKRNFFMVVVLYLKVKKSVNNILIKKK